MPFQSYVTNAKKCPPGEMKITRRGYNTKAGKRVKPATFCATDRGRPGRGPKTIPTPRKGALGGPGYTIKTTEARHRLLRKHLREHGYASTIAALQSRINLGSRTMTRTALAVFEKDKRWVQKHGETMATKNTRKKPLTAKQKANDKRLGRMSKARNAKKRGKKKTSKKKRGKKKGGKKKTSKKTRKVCTAKKKGGKKKCKRVAKKKCKKSRKVKKTKRAKKRAARGLQAGKSSAGKNMATRSWCRNFMNLNFSENDLGSIEEA